MMIDSQLNFVPIGGNLPISLLTGGSTPSTNVIDILGSGVGTAPANIIGNRTVFGSDVGIGAIKPQVEAVVGTAFTTSNSATLNVEFQAAVDAGTPTYQPGTWQTLVETGPIAVANLAANTVLARFDFPPAFPAGLNPRYLRLNFVVASGTAMTAGTISSAIVTMVRDDLANKYMTNNYVVA